MSRTTLSVIILADDLYMSLQIQGICQKPGIRTAQLLMTGTTDPHKCCF